MKDARLRLMIGAAAVFCCLLSNAQPFGNEWIHYDQQYWKFPVSADGIYRISYTDLANAAFPVANALPANIQVFGRGRECPIVISGESDGVFDPGDFIEFYARGNDAWLDSLIYDDPLHLPNPEFSLFNDTIHYFITVGSSPGLRMSVSSLNSFNAFEPLTHCRVESSMEFHNEYLVGKQDVNGISLPLYEEAEGWFDFKFPKGSTHEKNIPTPGVYSGADAPPAKALCISAGASMATGFPNHHMQIGWGEPLTIAADTQFYGYQLNKISFEIPTTQLGNQYTRIVHRSIDDIDVASDYNAVSYIKIDYPHTFDFSGLNSFSFAIPGNATSLYSLIEITSLSASNPRLFVANNAASMEVQLYFEDGLWKALVPMDGSLKLNLWLTSGEEFFHDIHIEPVSNTGFFTDYVSEEISNAFLIIAHPTLWNAALNYSAWRNTGDLHALVVNVEELYMQYSCGIDKNPLAIRRFCDDLLHSWSAPPADLFLLGKSIHDANVNGLTGSRLDADRYARNLVPTWGYPGSDIAFTAGLFGTLYQPAIPTGRLSATNPTQVLEYLNKVIEHETQPPALWQKNVLHFGGGSIDFEQFTFKTYLNNYKSIATDTSMGAHVYSFFKNTSDPIQMNVSDSIQLLINQGVSVMTFFGHASSTGFDQNIDSPQSYNNQGKYPLLIGNSCYTGNIHLGTNESASENFVLVPDRGVIGFLAKSDVGLAGFLDLYTNNFYHQFCQQNYGKSIGQCMQKSIENFQETGNLYRANVAYNFALHGDPAVRIHAFEKPDYSVSQQSIFFEPDDATASQTTLDVMVAVENIGKATNDPIGVELVRHYPNNVDSSYAVTMDRILNLDTVVFHIPNNTDIAAGPNTFDVLVDYPIDLIPELDDAGNNVVYGKALLISSGDLFPVVPYQFQVIDQSQPVLKAVTGFPFEPNNAYVMQADTTDLFNSPMLQTYHVSHAGGVVEWTLPFVMTDSMVVFWRCSPDSVSVDHGFKWHNSSFQYITDRNGWGQQHFFQFRDDALSNLDYNENNRSWSFDPTQANLKCEVYGAANTSFEGLATRYQLNLNVQDYGGYDYSIPALMVAVLDSSTFIPWESNYNGENPDHDFGNTMVSANARNRTERYFIFQQYDAAQLEGFASMIEQVPDDDYILIYTWQYAQKDNWNSLAPAVTDAFQALGANNILAATDSLPFIFFMKKGHPETVQEVIGSTSDAYIMLEVPLQGSMGSGSISGPVIGPSENWGSAEWEFSAIGSSLGDSSRVQLHGITWQGADFQLANLPQQPSQILNLNSFVDASQFPFLRLTTTMRDVVNYSAPQLDKWHVLYDLAPECAVNPSVGFYLNKDTLDQGEHLLLAVAIQNISSIPMDSLKVNYQIEDDQRTLHSLAYPLQMPLLPGQILYDTLEINTTDYPGLNVIHIEANPFDNVTLEPNQPEQYHFNNLAKIQFYVKSDNINPILDVTFDGQHILSGDIISPEPHILISLDDENEFFILNEDADTSNFKMFIRRPGADYVPIAFSSPEIAWTTASAPANKFKIDYTPKYALDGKYTLKVQATDKSGNVSGNYDYQIDFVIDSKPTITEVLNYPNPFSTRTQFVFTLTGVEPPDQFKIQIMTVTGDIVREITQDEIGPIRIGRNLSEYWWDGTDEYGDRLANGVYLYRVVARIHGENIEINPTAASRYFTKGFGKMYLMR